MSAPGPDLCTLRAWAEVDLALERGVTVDAAHGLITDAADVAFGLQLYDRVSEALAGEGRDPVDLRVLLTSDPLARRVLDRLHERMGEGHEAPEPPDDDHAWMAFGPDDPSGSREHYRRAVRRRAQNARRALLAPAAGASPGPAPAKASHGAGRSPERPRPGGSSPR